MKVRKWLSRAKPKRYFLKSINGVKKSSQGAVIYKTNKKYYHQIFGMAILIQRFNINNITTTTKICNPNLALLKSRKESGIKNPPIVIHNFNFRFIQSKIVLIFQNSLKNYSFQKNIGSFQPYRPILKQISQKKVVYLIGNV